MLIKNRDIVLFSFQPWDAQLGSNFKDMAFELSRFNRVLFVNRALDRASLWKQKDTPLVQTCLASIRKGMGELVQIQPGLWVQNPRTIVESINWIPIGALHDLLNKFNNRRLAREINKVILLLKFSEVILINDNDFIRGRYLKRFVDCTDYIFYKRDNMHGVGYFQRHGPRLESALLKEVHMVATNSSYLQKQAKIINKNSYDIGQGCDTKIYVSRQTFVPTDLRSLSKPIIGFTGYISAWRIDIEVLTHIALNLPECSIVLVGPVDNLFKMEDIRHLKNLHFLGCKPASDLPAYISSFEVCINPQVLNEITMGNYPRKIDEYLAMGKPVVATQTEAMKLFEPYTMLCNSKEEFVEKIKQVLGNPLLFNSEKEKQRRVAFALTHTWENSLKRLGEAYYATKNNMTEPAAMTSTDFHGLLTKNAHE